MLTFGLFFYYIKEVIELNTTRFRLIHIHMMHLVTRRVIRQFLRVDPTLATIYEMTPNELSLQFSISPKKASLLFSSLHDPQRREQFIRDIKKYKMITIVDDNYPPMLKTIKDAPIVLYAIGDLSLLNHSKALSVIGSRKPSNEARPKMEYILTPLLQEKWLIVSGMARGIDGYAHSLALSNQAKTIAVLGGGFEYIYPKEHTSLFKEIAHTGLILTEYPPNVKPAKHHFPERNRIISGLSFGTLVIEAMERSGTMITVEQALDQGRDVFAVPGSPLLPQTKGCHILIQEGAKLTHHARDIQEEWLAQQEPGKEKLTFK